MGTRKLPVAKALGYLRDSESTMTSARSRPLTDSDPAE